MRKRTEPDYFDTPDETYWIPYCLSFLSRYPLYNLLGDYLRGMWIHWNKATNLFHAEEVSRILSFPAPRLNDLVRIDMKDYALCYQFPSSPTGFQNFSMWPLFMCLSIPNIVGVIEAAISPTRRIIFISHYPAMLTVAAETIRYCVRVYEWSGLYVPVVHARHAKDLTQEPGPYILGITAECRTLFTAPSDALVVDLDKNFVLTSSPPTALSASQRSKMIARLSSSLKGQVTPSGVPQHLRSAYGGGKLIPAGQIIIMKGEVESVHDPAWWNQDAVMTVMDHVCEKLVSSHFAKNILNVMLIVPLQNQNTGMKKIFGGSAKKPLMAKVSMRHLNEIVRERNQYSRDAMEAWQDFINLKARMDTELAKVTKRNNFLVEELESWKQQFLKFQAFAEQLTKETQDLKVKIENHKRENRRLTSLIEQQKDEAQRLAVRLTGTEKQRDDALEALVLQQEIAEELERERKRNKKELSGLQQTNTALSRQRDEAQRVVLHLGALIDSQSPEMHNLLQSVHQYPRQIERTQESDITPTLTNTSEAIAEQSESPSITPSSHTVVSDPLSSLHRRTSLLRRTSMNDVADRYLRDKTDSIADIIRNISQQCAAAVEGLQLAQSADVDEGASRRVVAQASGDVEQSEAGMEPSLASELGDDETERTSIPPTPDLVHNNRTSTTMSVTTEGTMRERDHVPEVPEVPTRIMGQFYHQHEPVQIGDHEAQHEDGTVTKQAIGEIAHSQARPQMEAA